MAEIQSSYERLKRLGPVRPAWTESATAAEPSPIPSAFSLKSVKRIDGQTYSVDESEVEAILDNLSALAIQARIIPAFANGKPKGFKLFAILEGSFFEQLGLKNGDIVLTVNGFELNSPARALEIYQSLRGAESTRLLIERNKAQLRLEWRTRSENTRNPAAQ